MAVFAPTTDQVAARRLLAINFALPLIQVPFVSYAIYLSNSVAILADALGVYIGVIEMALVWLIHRYAGTADGVRQEKFHYGFGKLENLSVLLICALEAIISMLILIVAIEDLRHPRPLEGAWFGMIVLVVATAIHICVLIAYREHFRTSTSPIIRSFKALIPIYLLNNAVVLVPVALGTFVDNELLSVYADPVGAVVLVGFAWMLIYGLASRSVTCLIDRAVDEQVQLRIFRMLTDHFDLYDTIHDIRTRAVGEQIHVELQIGFDPSMRVGDLETVVTSMAARAAELVPNVRLVVSPVPLPLPESSTA